MDMNHIFEPVRKIEMPEDMQRHIIRHCRERGAKKAAPAGRRIAAFAVLAIILCAAAVGAERHGYFRDIKTVFGAVTGTEYLEATAEIGVSARLSNGNILLDAEFLYPDEAPFRYIEALSADYSILDDAGKTLAKGESSAFPTEAGRVEIIIEPGALQGTPHTLLVEAFTSFKKADQPMKIKGRWETAIH